MKQIQFTLAELIRLMVNRPEDVSVIDTRTDKGTTFSVQVHPDDVGQVIEKQGRTARALRTIVSGVGKAGKQSIGLEIEDYQQNCRDNLSA